MEYRKFSKISEQQRISEVKKAKQKESSLYKLAAQNNMEEEVREIVREKISLIVMSYLNSKVSDEITRDFAFCIYFGVDQTCKIDFYKNLPKKEENDLLKIMRAYARWHAKGRTTKEE